VVVVTHSRKRELVVVTHSRKSELVVVGWWRVLTMRNGSRGAAQKWMDT